MERLTIPNPLTGPVIPKPQPRTIHWIVCWNAFCDSRTHLEGLTEDEVWKKWESGHAGGIYGSVYEAGTRQGYDPAEVAEYHAALAALNHNSCRIPPAEDLALLSSAKRTEPRDYGTIDPGKGIWKTTREKLHTIRNDKRNQWYEECRKNTP